MQYKLFCTYGHKAIKASNKKVHFSKVGNLQQATLLKDELLELQSSFFEELTSVAASVVDSLRAL